MHLLCGSNKQWSLLCSRYIQVPAKDDIWWKDDEEDEQVEEDCETDNPSETCNGTTEKESQENGGKEVVKEIPVLEDFCIGLGCPVDITDYCMI